MPDAILSPNMRTCSIFFLLTAALSAAMPNLSGVWKADLAQSIFTGGPPPPTSYLIIIEQKSDIVDRRTKETAPEFIDTTGTASPRGEHRTVLTAFEYSKPVVRSYDGIPTRMKGTSEGNNFVIVGEVAGTPDHFKRTYSLAADGKSMTLTIEGASEGHPMSTTLLLNKVPDAEGESLRKPEELASVRFKNVKVDALKNLPASEFISQMHYFAWSLGKECTFCHVERKFDADDKKEKKTARKMVEMAVAINEHNFEGHPEVRCYTCHEGHSHPPSRPMFADEVAAAQNEHDRADHDRPAPPPPAHN